MKRFIEELPQVADRIATHLDECKCDLACYNCLKDFRNQRRHELLDKRLVTNLFRQLAHSQIERSTDTLPQEFDSFLESIFYKLLENEGLLLPETQLEYTSSSGVRLRVDFVYPDNNLIILTDGYGYHANRESDIEADLAKRNSLEIDGYCVLEFTYGHVIANPYLTSQIVRSSLGQGEVNLRPGDVETVTENYPREILQAADDIAHHLVGYRANGTIPLFRGEIMVKTLLQNSETQIAVMLVDPSNWLQNPKRWQQDLTLHNLIRLKDWRLVRVTPQSLNHTLISKYLYRKVYIP